MEIKKLFNKKKCIIQFSINFLSTLNLRLKFFMYKKKKILITWHYLQPLKNDYKKIFKKNNILYDTKYKNPNFKEDELTKIINKYDGIICGDDEITKKVINTAVNLKVISKWGTGLNSIDVSYAKK